MFFFKPSILFIDDDASIRILVHSRLTAHHSYKVSTIDNGHDGILKAIKMKPDLIILDWVMPGLNGLETLNKIKSITAIKHTPVLMLTGKNLIGEIEDAFSSGADGYLTKPLDLKKLSKKIKELLN
ncbi:MAG: response regulator [gamma proteobacterium symbiont of Taylorina sp.]|nr:response regulator [gamma proteobacterium symbiont of Taylorina sp.]